MGNQFVGSWIVDSLVARLRNAGYTVAGMACIPQNGSPEQNLVYIAGHHSALAAYGHIRFMEDPWRNPETEITVLPPEVFFG